MRVTAELVLAGLFHVTNFDQSAIRYKICIKHNETVWVRHQRLLAFGPSLASLASDLTLVCRPSAGVCNIFSQASCLWYPGYHAHIFVAKITDFASDLVDE